MKKLEKVNMNKKHNPSATHSQAYDTTIIPHPPLSPGYASSDTSHETTFTNLNASSTTKKKNIVKGDPIIIGKDPRRKSSPKARRLRLVQKVERDTKHGNPMAKIKEKYELRKVAKYSQASRKAREAAGYDEGGFITVPGSTLGGALQNNVVSLVSEPIDHVILINNGLRQPFAQGPQNNAVDGYIGNLPSRLLGLSEQTVTLCNASERSLPRDDSGDDVDMIDASSEHSIASDDPDRMCFPGYFLEHEPDKVTDVVTQPNVGGEMAMAAGDKVTAKTSEIHKKVEPADSDNTTTAVQTHHYAGQDDAISTSPDTVMIVSSQEESTGFSDLTLLSKKNDWNFSPSLENTRAQDDCKRAHEATIEDDDAAPKIPVTPYSTEFVAAKLPMFITVPASDARYHPATKVWRTDAESIVPTSTVILSTTVKGIVSPASSKNTTKNIDDIASLEEANDEKCVVSEPQPTGFGLPFLRLSPVTMPIFTPRTSKPHRNTILQRSQPPLVGFNSLRLTPPLPSEVSSEPSLTVAVGNVSSLSMACSQSSPDIVTHEGSGTLVLSSSFVNRQLYFPTGESSTPIEAAKSTTITTIEPSQNRELFELRHTTLGDTSLEDFIDSLEFDGNGITTQKAICTTFFYLATKDHKPVGPGNVPLSSIVTDEDFKSPVLQHLIKLGHVSLFDFLRENSINTTECNTDLDQTISIISVAKTFRGIAKQHKGAASAKVATFLMLGV